MVRNPYAVVEGIARRKKNSVGSREEMISLASHHIMKCFELQKQNIEKYADESLYFSYETLCAQSDRVVEKLKAFVPQLTDLQMNDAIPVKGTYNESLRNMNEQQISQLSKEDLKNINRIFDQYAQHLSYFEYDRIS